ncbi:hypothetical protein CHS0354_032095 [Potamilus streckersoni]|uniref:Mammalian ependymin-related protein 1 n=1 Tax=Potamilus streckersoni TaxID=2493646 RepID=A0AAE0WGA2_9BIVA|nr:hypothetical protein CHS0354_032095 [Potamilus streckersoni]
MFIGLVLLALAVLSSEAYRCCVPTLWEANEGMMMASSVHGKSSLEEHFTRVSFDGNQKIVAVVYLSAPNQNKRIVQDFSKMTQYSIQGTECHKSILSVPWDPYCIADNATLLQDFYYGTPENRLDAQTFSTSRFGLNGYFTVTKRECVPIALTLMGTVSGVDNFWVFGMSNFTMGIQDPSFFNVPDTCT